MKSLRTRFENGSFALDAADVIYNTVLAAGVPELITKPANASHVFLSSNADIWANYVHTGEPSDLVSNGSFAVDADWTKGTGWTIAAGVASSDGTQAADADLSQNPPLGIIENQLYYVTFTVSGYSAGNVCAVIGGTEGTDRAADGTFSEYILAGSGAAIALRADSNFVGSIDNFSAIPAARVPTTENTTGRGSELNPAVRYINTVDAISLVSDYAAKVSLCFYRD